MLSVEVEPPTITDTLTPGNLSVAKKPMTAHILLVESDKTFARCVELELSCEGYTVNVAHDGFTGLAATREASPDLLILDASLPGMSGLDICRRLRATRDLVPIILLSETDEPTSCITGLDAGADDYLVKPFNFGELLARMRALLRRTHPEDTPDQLAFHDLQLNRLSHKVYRGGNELTLTAKEFELLDYLMSHAEQVVSRDQIMTAVWGYDFAGDTNVIEVYIRYLRNKLEADNSKRLIHTVRGVGYVLRR